MRIGNSYDALHTDGDIKIQSDHHLRTSFLPELVLAQTEVLEKCGRGILTTVFGPMCESKPPVFNK
jgi:hypothetical protein